ncbi:MAG: hypothetical protein ACPGYP_05080 [Solirubrobacterales bacterium]
MSASERSGNPLAIFGVFIGAAGFAASLTAVYSGMRELMYTTGGACASGGPYAITQQCDSASTTMLVGGILAMLLFGALLLGATSLHGGGTTLGVGLLMWGALFGALGFNFISLSVNPPEIIDNTSGWVISGVVFWMMALGGLIPGLVAAFHAVRGKDEFGDERDVSFSSPIVRANVNFERTMPGDPAFGMSDPSEIARSQTAASTPSESAPPRQVDTSDDFVDPVTGERIKPGGGSDA